LPTLALKKQETADIDSRNEAILQKDTGDVKKVNEQIKKIFGTDEVQEEMKMKTQYLQQLNNLYGSTGEEKEKVEGYKS